MSGDGPGGAGAGGAPGPAATHAKAAALTAYGRALRAWYEGDRDAEITLHSSLGEHEPLPVGFFFREPAAFFPAERYALELCRGRVLDLGAGTGLHGMVLRERGLPVVGLEIEPRAARIAHERGARPVVRGHLLRLPFRGGTFDTVLMLMNGIGPVGTLADLPRFLGEAERVLAPGGQLLFDSGEAVPAEGAEEERERWPPPTEEDYAGEAWIRLEFRGETGPPFRELYLDRGTLARRCLEHGWACQIAFEGEGVYLARLRPT